jgi:hypothetical protein
MSRRAATIGLFALAAFAGGCSWTHRCTVPTPVVEAGPGPRLPVAVEVRYAPPAVPAEVTQANEFGGSVPEHRMVVNAVAPTRAMFDRLAASLFERTVSVPPAEAILEIRLDRFGIGTSMNSAFSDVAYRATVRTADGAEVAAFDVEGASTVAASLRHLGFCGARGEAVAVAMQQAGETLVQKVSESDALAAWLAARGMASVRFTVKPFEAYAEPTPTSATPSPTTSASASGPPRAPPVPVHAGAPPLPLAPRSFRLRVGLAQFRPESTAGKLEDPSKGLAVTVVGGEFRLTSVLRTDIDLELAERDYSATYVPHYTGFGPRATLDSTSVGVGLRGSPPLGDRPPVEPWLGASARIIYTKLKVTYFGGLAYSEAHEAFSVGADVGGGVNFFLGERWGLGMDVRWRFARASLAPLGSVSIGGLLIGGTFFASLPP